jgi:hypothetical protein
METSPIVKLANRTELVGGSLIVLGLVAASLIPHWGAKAAMGGALAVVEGILLFTAGRSLRKHSDPQRVVPELAAAFKLPALIMGIAVFLAVPATIMFHLGANR